MSKWLSVSAIVISLAAVAACIWMYLTLDDRITIAVQRREQQFVDRYSPQVTQICDEFAVDPPLNPTTVDDLIVPLVKIVTRISGG